MNVREAKQVLTEELKRVKRNVAEAAEEEAERVVVAVNAYDPEREAVFGALVEALKRARKRMWQYGESKAELDEIDAALALAEVHAGSGEKERVSG